MEWRKLMGQMEVAVGGRVGQEAVLRVIVGWLMMMNVHLPVKRKEQVVG